MYLKETHSNEWPWSKLPETDLCSDEMQWRGKYCLIIGKHQTQAAVALVMMLGDANVINVFKLSGC